MKNSFTNIIIFAAGAAFGSAVTWKLLKTKYEQIAQEEIESVKEAFAKINESSEITEDNLDAPTPAEEKNPDLAEYCDIIAEQNYTNGEKGGKELMDGVKPYVISPEDFGEHEDYETVTLSYYADGVLALEYYDVKTESMAYQIIDDVENTVGADSLNHFGEYEDDSVHVRNDFLECDYEILKDFRNFEDAILITPNPEDAE